MIIKNKENNVSFVIEFVYPCIDGYCVLISNTKKREYICNSFITTHDNFLSLLEDGFEIVK